jgi:hypothetical protein
MFQYCLEIESASRLYWHINITLNNLVEHLCPKDGVLGAKDWKRTRPRAPVRLKQADLHGGRRSRTYNIFPLYGLTPVGRNTHLGPVLGFKSLQRRHLLNLLRQDSEWRDRAGFKATLI